ncbi:hypothetical protein [Martelella sp. HB161492]|uniref:hypothetical protein n=1 Tax=Martelella sp. HB161492 TaxID=2720726 RepID=UPI00158FD24D|nr:hypothetical protein [Martelella sp. HB161492]
MTITQNTASTSNRSSSYGTFAQEMTTFADVHQSERRPQQPLNLVTLASLHRQQADAIEPAPIVRPAHSDSIRTASEISPYGRGTSFGARAPEMTTFASVHRSRQRPQQPLDATTITSSQRQQADTIESATAVQPAQSDNPHTEPAAAGDVEKLKSLITPLLACMYEKLGDAMRYIENGHNIVIVQLGALPNIFPTGVAPKFLNDKFEANMWAKYAIQMQVMVTKHHAVTEDDDGRRIHLVVYLHDEAGIGAKCCSPLGGNGPDDKVQWGGPVQVSMLGVDQFGFGMELRTKGLKLGDWENFKDHVENPHFRREWLGRIDASIPYISASNMTSSSSVLTDVCSVLASVVPSCGAERGSVSEWPLMNEDGSTNHDAYKALGLWMGATLAGGISGQVAGTAISGGGAVVNAAGPMRFVLASAARCLVFLPPYLQYKGYNMPSFLSYAPARRIVWKNHPALGPMDISVQANGGAGKTSGFAALFPRVNTQPFGKAQDRPENPRQDQPAPITIQPEHAESTESINMEELIEMMDLAPPRNNREREMPPPRNAEPTPIVTIAEINPRRPDLVDVTLEDDFATDEGSSARLIRVNHFTDTAQRLGTQRPTARQQIPMTENDATATSRF